MQRYGVVEVQVDVACGWFVFSYMREVADDDGDNDGVAAAS